MVFYLDTYRGDGTRANPFEPLSFKDDPSALAIDLRPDASRPDGFCIVRSELVLPAAANRSKIADDKTTKSSALVNTLQARLNLNLPQSSMAMTDVLAELLITQARTDGTRWNPLRPGYYVDLSGKNPPVSRYEIWMGELIWSQVVVAGGAMATESFDHANSTTSMNNEWTWTALSGSTWGITGNHGYVVSINTALDLMARAEFDTGETDMYAQAVLANLSHNMDWGVGVRYDSSATTGYATLLFDGGSPQGQKLMKIVANAWTGLTSSITRAYTVGDIVRIEAQGSTLRYIVNGASQFTVTDTSITGGTRGGLTGWAGAGGAEPQFDNFEVGGLFPIQRYANNDNTGKRTGTTTTSVTVPWKKTPKVNSMLVVIGAASDAINNAATPTGYLDQGRVSAFDASFTHTLFKFTRVASGTETNVVWVDDVVDMDLFIFEYRGFVNNPSVDQKQTNSSGNMTTVSTLTTGVTGTTTAANEVGIAAFAIGSGISSLTWTSATSLGSSLDTNTSLYVADAQYTATGTKSASVSWTTAKVAVGTIMTLIDTLNKTLDLTGQAIASGQALGTPTIVAPITITLAGIASAEAEGTPTLIRGQFALPVAIASGEAEGTPTLIGGPTSFSLVGIVSGEAVGVPNIATGSAPTQAISVVAIASAEARGTPTILSPVTVAIAGIASVGIVSNPTVIVFAPVPVSYSPDFDRFDNIQVFVVDKFGTNFGELPGIVVDSVEWKLNESGSAKVTFNNQDPSISKLLLMKRELQVIWNDTINAETGLPEIWWGILGGESGKPGEKSFTLEGVQSWLKTRPIETASIDFNVATDQFDIAWSLINTAQTGTNRGLNFTASYAPSGHQRLRHYDRERHQYFYDLLMEFSSLKLTNGFDWEFVLDRAAGHRIWTPYYPSKGVYRPECKLEWGRNIVDYSFQRDGFGMATKAYGTGASSNGVKFEQSYEDTTKSAEYGVITRIVSDSGQSDVDWLLDLAHKTVDLRSSPITTFSVKVKDILPGPENNYQGVPIFGRLHVGDTVDVNIDDYGNQVVGTFRVLSFKWNASGIHDVDFVNPIDLVTV